MFTELMNLTWIDWLASIVATIVVCPFLLRFYFRYPVVFMEILFSTERSKALVRHRLFLTRLHDKKIFHLSTPFVVGLGVSTLNHYADLADSTTRLLLFYSLMLLYIGTITIVSYAACQYMLRRAERNQP